MVFPAKLQAVEPSREGSQARNLLFSDKLDIVFFQLAIKVSLRNIERFRCQLAVPIEPLQSLTDGPTLDFCHRFSYQVFRHDFILEKGLEMLSRFYAIGESLSSVKLSKSRPER